MATYTNKAQLATQMVHYLQSIYGSIDNLNKYQANVGMEHFNSWADLTQHLLTNSGSFNQLYGGKTTMEAWKALNLKNALTIPSTPAALQKSGPQGAPNEQKDAFATLLSTLHDYGLDNLATWLWGEITKGTPESQIFLDLRQTDAYKKRFPGMELIQKNGLPAISEAEYIRNEDAYRTILKNSGADPSKYSSPAALATFFGQDLSPSEVQQRAEMWDLLTKSPQTAARVRGLFQQYAKVNNLTDEQLFNIIVDSNDKMLQQLSSGLDKAGATGLNNLQNWITQAMNAEKATWQGGGGSIVQSQGGALSGLLSQEKGMT